MSGVALHYFVKSKVSKLPIFNQTLKYFFFILPLDSFPALNRYSLTTWIESINFMKRKLIQKKQEK